MTAGRIEGEESRGPRGRSPGGALILALALLSAGCASAGSPYEGMTADDFWAAGMAAFEEEDWAKAILYFDLLLQTNAAHPNAPDARFLKAASYEGQKDYIVAYGEYEIFLDTYYSHPRSPEASLGICRSHVMLSPIPQRDQTETRAAREACARTAIEFQGLTVAEEAEAYRRQMVERLGEAAYEIAAHYERINSYLPALEVYERVLTEHWDTSWAPKAMEARRRIYLELGWEEEAEEEELRLEYNYPDSEPARALRAEREGAARPGDSTP